MKRLIIVLALVCLASSLAFAEEATGGGISAESWKYIAAALSVGISCIAGGIAVGQIGAAAMGAMSENPELAGKALPYAGLAEGICLWGFLIGLLILVMN
jgi:V/A-type H+-transporting ATPase subunit K